MGMEEEYDSLNLPLILLLLLLASSLVSFVPPPGILYCGLANVCTHIRVIFPPKPLGGGTYFAHMS